MILKFIPLESHRVISPQKTCNALEEYIDKTKMELTSLQPKRFRDNISKEEREALSSLKNNKNIVIKKADKSNTIVIMDKQQYTTEAQRQLQSKHYMQVEKPDLKELHNCIQDKVNEMHLQESLDKETYRFLKDNKPALKCGQLYLLPKIHKIKDDVRNALINNLCSIRQLPPGRPIISQCETPTRNIGAYCDYFLIPIVRKQSTYIKDTTDFINKIESQEFPPDVQLITYDVTSMYTNMEFDELLSAVHDAYNNANKNEYCIPHPDVKDLLFLLKCVLDNNYFEFDGKYYKQIIGCSMGAVPSPELSDIRMYQITQLIVSKFKHAKKILFHGRFRDDGFIVFDGTENEMMEFFDIGNSCHKHLKFTFEIAHNSVTFLDTLVFKGQRFLTQNKLDLKSYIKPTNNFQYLHRDSAHNPAVFKAFIKGECIRHARNTNDPHELEEILGNFKTHLSKRGYSATEIDPVITEITYTKRELLLHKSNKQKHHQPNVMITKYNPSLKGLRGRILKYWNKMTTDPICRDLFKSEPIIAYSKHKNVGDILIRSKLQQ